MSFALLQSKLRQAAYQSTTNVAYNSTTASGSLLVLKLAMWGTGPNCSAVSDPVNGAWTEAGSIAAVGNANVQVFFRLNAGSITAAQNVTLTLASGTSGDNAIVLEEFSSGNPTGVALDPTYTTGTGNGTAATNTTVTTGTINTNNAGDLYLTVCGDDNAADVTWTAPTTPWAFVQQSGSITFCAVATEERHDGPASGAYSQTIVQSANGNMAAKIVAFTEGVSSTLTQLHARFYNDDGSESAATGLAGEDVNAVVPFNTNVRLRTLLDFVTGAPGAVRVTRQFRKAGTNDWKGLRGG